MPSRAGVGVVAAALVGWSLVTGRIPARWHPVPHVLFGTAVWASTRAPLGFRPPALGRGVRWGAAAAAPVLAGVAVGTAIPPVRAGMAAQTLPGPVSHWMLVRIPLGTVWSEEAAYRAGLGTVAARAFGPRVGRLIAAAVFGLSHVPDARATGQPVTLTVLATGAAGWVFDWLYTESGSLAAPILAHLAVNEAGAAAALAVQRRRCGRGRPADAARSSGRRSRS